MLKRTLSLVLLLLIFFQTFAFADNRDKLEALLDRYEKVSEKAASIDELLVTSDRYNNELLLFIADILLEGKGVDEALQAQHAAFAAVKDSKAYDLEQQEAILRNQFYLLHLLATALDRDGSRGDTIGSVLTEYEQDRDKITVEQKIHSALYRNMDMATITALLMDRQNEYGELIGGIFDEFLKLDEAAKDVVDQLVAAYHKQMEIYTVMVLLQDPFGTHLADIKENYAEFETCQEEMQQPNEKMLNSSHHSFQALYMLADALLGED